MEPLTVSRFIAAPPEKVWDVLANRQDEWWCPPPWRSQTKVLEKRAGGRWYGVMHGPAGERVENDGLILEWEEGRRFVGTDGVRIENGTYVPQDAFMIGEWSIEPGEQDGVAGTVYTAAARHWSDEARRRHEDMGMIEGWQVCAAQLAAICERE